MTVHHPPGGAEQEVPDTRRPDPAACGHVHLHQCPCRLPKVHAATGPLHHPAYHFSAADAGKLHAADLY